ncbi:hypothetical protein FQN54_003022 [Arachnomyces sp. PD_36]|nr:hypothetical protein FQN54_003022 [Arachnomyces sp. PD_36]
MPPFLPRKRQASPDTHQSKRNLLAAIDAEPANTPTLEESKAFEIPGDDSSGSSSLSDVPSAIANEDGADEEDDDDDGEDEEVDWEDAMAEGTQSSSIATPQSQQELGDLELTLDKNVHTLTDVLQGKKGPSKLERVIRVQTHCMHVQCLLFHNAIRNSWINDSKVHEALLEQLPPGIEKEIEKWRVASGQGKVAKEPPTKRQKHTRSGRDWGGESSRVEPGKPDLSGGDPIIPLLRVLSAYWKKRFRITAPGLRKKGYKPMSVLGDEVSSFHKDDYDPDRHGERVGSLAEFRDLARSCKGSRDIGAQLFTALLRALGIEARMVASLQPIGFGWSKAENSTEMKDKEAREQSGSEEESDAKGKGKKAVRGRGKDDLPFPIYWTEVISGVTQEILPVESLILPHPVATTPELLGAFEPRGAKADKFKQVIAYVVAHSSDGTAKDVTTRYLKRRLWPGKTKGFRMPVEKIQLNSGMRGPARYYHYDWFKVTMRGYVRPDSKRTALDDLEDARDLTPAQPQKKATAEVDTLQSLRSSPEFVLERFLRREEAIRPGSEHARIFKSGKGDKAKEEKVFRRADVVRCLSAESWHKEGRRVKMGETPLKLVPVRAVTLTRKQEVDVIEQETGEKPKQGLYALHQTEYIIPPPIKDGIIPKNAYGNIDCFVPTMVPKGATHVPWRGTVRICKRLGVDYAEAVTGFEFGNKRAVPVIEGVVVCSENAGLVRDAWLEDEREKRKKDRLKQEKLVLSTWKKFLIGLRIVKRVHEEYGEEKHDETHNPFTNRRKLQEEARGSPDEEEHQGGGFLLPEEDEERLVESQPEVEGGNDDEDDEGSSLLSEADLSP